MLLLFNSSCPFLFFFHWITSTHFHIFMLWTYCTAAFLIQYILIPISGKIVSRVFQWTVIITIWQGSMKMKCNRSNYMCQNAQDTYRMLLGLLLQFLQTPTSTNTEVQWLQTSLHLPDPHPQTPHFMFHIYRETSILENKTLMCHIFLMFVWTTVTL